MKDKVFLKLRGSFIICSFVNTCYLITCYHFILPICLGRGGGGEGRERDQKGPKETEKGKEPVKTYRSGAPRESAKYYWYLSSAFLYFHLFSIQSQLRCVFLIISYHITSPTKHSIYPSRGSISFLYSLRLLHQQ